MTSENQITVSITVNGSIDKVWEYWNGAEHIPYWAFASSDWGAKSIENELQTGGHFKTKMFARDGSFSFDFEGDYTNVQFQKNIEYIMTDGRAVSVDFNEIADGVEIIQMFDPETENSIEDQRSGWQAFLDNFKAYVERA
jgi:uncharacterized protein YndB with AHSA1/START domain